MQSVVCVIRGEGDIYVAVWRGRELANALGFNAIDQTRIEIAILELTRNLLAHAKGGMLRLEALQNSGPPERTGLMVIAQDTGPGIPNIALALQDGYSTTATMGAGLPGVKRLMDEFEIESTVGVGTTVRAIKWLTQHRKRGA
ncbi:MAG: anti-sigma regulatory factor [Chloroflexaceae bacterium]|nr:anti-sigma regulatory factor [Chloroflexaceae bacterium]NJL33233.1 anti-sigma regulatory factor [Chloroflexaceae bacterium]NJO04392.1 anti-sigma regulatory factor [Chloroflexaceae bacterium]